MGDKAPKKCPVCKSVFWKPVDIEKTFSVGKAIVGNLIVPGFGTLAGIKGKKKVLYVCEKCGFRQEYDL